MNTHTHTHHYCAQYEMSAGDVPLRRVSFAGDDIYVSLCLNCRDIRVLVRRTLYVRGGEYLCWSIYVHIVGTPLVSPAYFQNDLSLLLPLPGQSIVVCGTCHPKLCVTSQASRRNHFPLTNTMEVRDCTIYI